MKSKLFFSMLSAIIILSFVILSCNNKDYMMDKLDKMIEDKENAPKNAQLEMNNIVVAIVTFKADTGSLPKSVKDLYKANIIQEVLMTDPWGTAYQLEYQPGSYTVKIISAGPDRKFKTQDDIILEGNI